MRKLLRLAWPVALSMFLHNSYSLADMFWVASLGTAEVAVVTLCGILMFIVFALAQIFATGVHALIARACGSGNLARAAAFLRDGLLAALLTGIGISLIASLCPGGILRMLGASSEITRTGIPYMHAMAIGFPFAICMITLGSAFRATGDMLTPLYLTGISCLLNIFLDPLFIFGLGPIPGYGLAGAALATAISLAIALLLGVAALFRHRILASFRLAAPFRLIGFRDMMAVGLPSGFHYALLSLTQMAMIRMVAEFGKPAVAAAGIGARYMHLTFLPCIGLGAATATLVGQYIGAQQPEQAENIVRLSLKINLCITLTLSALFFSFPVFFYEIFTPDPEVLANGRIFLRIAAIAFLFTTNTILLTRVFQGAGDTLWPTLAAAVRVVVFLGAAALLGWRSGLAQFGVWLAMGIGSAVQMAIVAWLYSLGTWKRRELRSVVE
jgi:putative MATE family efflux protein